MDYQERKAHNLKVLKRHDPLVTDILDSTSHVVVYDFDEAKQSWNKKGIEGTLFIVQRNSRVRHRMLILNRLSLDPFDVDLMDTIEFQVTGDYVIYRDPAQDSVQGLWIYEPEDRIRLAESLQEKCATSVLPTQTVPEHPQTGINLMHLLLNNKNAGGSGAFAETNAVVPNGSIQQHQQQHHHHHHHQQQQQHQNGFFIQQQQQQQHQQMQPISTMIPPIKHLQVLWSVLDTCLVPHHLPRSLSFEEFNARLGRLVQEPGFQANLYDAYKTV
ncbi:mRNA-decapping enzyme 1B [Chytriomyces hyalinus]|nr:mRNA-decapping enzyme 1B [Chytriomyces hyalinus]